MSRLISADELHDFLREQIPSATVPELNRAAHALELMFRFYNAKPARTTLPLTTSKPKSKPVRHYKEKSVAESLGLKR